MLMAHVALFANGDGSEVERCSWPARAALDIARSHAAPCIHLRAIEAPGISVSAESLPAGSPRGSSGGHCADHVEAAAAHRTTAAQAGPKKWQDDGGDRDRRAASFPANKEEAWLSRAKGAACSKSMLIMSLIGCSSRNSARPTTFWFPVGSVL